jgi:ATP phosphoribosyltransferase
MTLTLAIPSKGRLKEQTEEFFSRAGIPIEPQGGSRGYLARIARLPGIEVRLMSAGEIASAVIAGEVHVGVSGEDLLRELAGDLERVAHLVAPLGFGRADLVVAVPVSWLDVETMADVDDVGARLEARTGRKLRVATKYVRSTRRFFTAEGVGHYRIVESAGATEGAPASGAADIIVDITTTGATLKSNGLKILRDGLILASQANLAASVAAVWSTDALAALRTLLAGIDSGAGKDVGFDRFQAALTSR